jgi:hypothetical protein
MLFEMLPAVSCSCSDAFGEAVNSRSVSWLCSSTSWLNCSVRRTISILSLTRPFQSSAMMVAATISFFAAERHSK